MPQLTQILVVLFMAIADSYLHHDGRPEGLYHPSPWNDQRPITPLADFFHDLFKPPNIPGSEDQREPLSYEMPTARAFAKDHNNEDIAEKNLEEILTTDNQDANETAKDLKHLTGETASATPVTEEVKFKTLAAPEESVKLSKVIDSGADKDPHPIKFPVAEDDTKNDTILSGNKADLSSTASNSVNSNSNEDPTLSKNSDFLLIPVATAVNPTPSFAGSFNNPNTGNAVQGYTPISNGNENPNVLNQGANLPAYQLVNTLPQNQEFIPISNLPNTGANHPNLYTVVTVPNNVGLQTSNNGIPFNQMYVLSSFPQTNSGFQNNYPPVYNVVGTSNNKNQPNLVTLTNLPKNLYPNNNMVGFNGQPNNLASINNLQNNMIPTDNRLNNDGNFNYIPSGNQPNNMVGTNNPSSNEFPLNIEQNSMAGFGNLPYLLALSNQPNNLVSLGNQPSHYGNQPSNYGSQPSNYGNQPNNYGNQPYNYGNQPNNYGNQPNNYGNQPNNLIAFSNQPNNIPVVMQGTSNAMPLYSLKDKAEERTENVHTETETV